LRISTLCVALPVFPVPADGFAFAFGSAYLPARQADSISTPCSSPPRSCEVRTVLFSSTLPVAKAYSRARVK